MSHYRVHETEGCEVAHKGQSSGSLKKVTKMSRELLKVHRVCAGDDELYALADWTRCLAVNAHEVKATGVPTAPAHQEPHG